MEKMLEARELVRSIVDEVYDQIDWKGAGLQELMVLPDWLPGFAADKVLGGSLVDPQSRKIVGPQYMALERLVVDLQTATFNGAMEQQPNDAMLEAMTAVDYTQRSTPPVDFSSMTEDELAAVTFSLGLGLLTAWISQVITKRAKEKRMEYLRKPGRLADELEGNQDGEEG